MIDVSEQGDILLNTNYESFVWFGSGSSGKYCYRILTKNALISCLHFKMR